MLSFNDPFIAMQYIVFWFGLHCDRNCDCKYATEAKTPSKIEKPQRRRFKVVSNGFDQLQLFFVFGIENIYTRLIICAVRATLSTNRREKFHEVLVLAFIRLLCR